MRDTVLAKTACPLWSAPGTFMLCVYAVKQFPDPRLERFAARVALSAAGLAHIIALAMPPSGTSSADGDVDLIPKSAAL